MRPAARAGEQRGFGLGHGLHHRQAAVIVKIDADAQVDLVGAGIFLEVLVEREDRVAGEGFDVCEHGMRWNQVGGGCCVA
ncbi:hypothetical protein D9M68_705860 [compost metagenome]